MNSKTIKETFPVIGMSCASCAISAENTIKDQSGVLSASVNFASSLLSVEYQPNEIESKELKCSTSLN